MILNTLFSLIKTDRYESITGRSARTKIFNEFQLLKLKVETLAESLADHNELSSHTCNL